MIAVVCVLSGDSFEVLESMLPSEIALVSGYTRAPFEQAQRQEDSMASQMSNPGQYLRKKFPGLHRLVFLMDESCCVHGRWSKLTSMPCALPTSEMAWRDCGTTVATLTNLDARVDEFFCRGGEELLMRLGDVQVVSSRVCRGG